MAIFGARDDKAPMANDPVCGMRIVQAHAFGPEDSAEGPAWFCSPGCRTVWLAEHMDPGERPRGVEA